MHALGAHKWPWPTRGGSPPRPSSATQWQRRGALAKAWSPKAWSSSSRETPTDEGTNYKLLERDVGGGNLGGMEHRAPAFHHSDAHSFPLLPLRCRGVIANRAKAVAAAAPTDDSFLVPVVLARFGARSRSRLRPQSDTAHTAAFALVRELHRRGGP